MKFRLFVAGLLLAGVAASVNAECLLAEQDPKGPYQVYDLGPTPVGSLLTMSWFPGNMTVVGKNLGGGLAGFESTQYRFRLNIPDDFLKSKEASRGSDLEFGELHTVELADGTKFTFYWRWGDHGNVLLVLFKHSVFKPYPPPIPAKSKK